MNITPLVASIVTTYVGSHPVDPGTVPELIVAVHEALSRLLPAAAASPAIPASATPASSNLPGQARPVPAVAVDRSVTPDYLVCLEDGKQFKTLKRHLREAFGLSPDEYRRKWGLPADYPMTAPNYAKRRSQISKAAGLGGRARKPMQGGWPVWRGQ